MRLKFFEVDQRLETLRVPLVTILAREMRLKFFEVRPSFGNVASAAGHDIGAKNFAEKLSIAVLAPTSWLAALAPHSLRGLHVHACFNRISRTKSWQKRPLFAIACKARPPCPLRLHSRQAIVDTMPLSLFTIPLVAISLAGFYFYAIEFTPMSWMSIFARNCDCDAVVNSLAIAWMAISTRYLRLSSLLKYGIYAKSKMPFKEFRFECFSDKNCIILLRSDWNLYSKQISTKTSFD